jgi:hypothetical protein
LIRNLKSRKAAKAKEVLCYYSELLLKALVLSVEVLAILGRLKN